MFEPTLHGLISQVEAGRVALPAMQRPFVWSENRIERLIDSLLREFPLGAVMLWKSKEIQRVRRFKAQIRTDLDEAFEFESTPPDGDRYLVLDGQQRLTSLLVAIKGTYDGRRFYLDVLSGASEDKDPGEIHFDGRFMTAREVSATNASAGTSAKSHFVLLEDLVKIRPTSVGILSLQKRDELGLDDEQMRRISDLYIRTASAMGSTKALQVIFIGEDPSSNPSIDEVLEIFVRVNSGGLVLHKSDLLMSLLDLHWNDIQPDLVSAVSSINKGRPYDFDRDDLLKSLLLVRGAETRFDKLVGGRKNIGELAPQIRHELPRTTQAWRLLAVILNDDCRIYAERFFRGGHNALLPFVAWLYHNPRPTPEQKRDITLAIYIAIMSGVFGGAETRMGKFVRQHVRAEAPFPLREMCEVVKWHTGVTSFETLCTRHLDLTLNIAHGGISLDNNPEELQRDHIFPRATLSGEGFPVDKVNHFANFHFLRREDNQNKSDRPPHDWFRSPGGAPPYSNQDLEERLLTWDLLQPGKFEELLQTRKSRIYQRASDLFGRSIEEIDQFFE